MKTSEQEESVEELGPDLSRPSDNGSRVTTAQASQSIDAEQSGSSKPLVNERNLSSLVRRATGPRTLAGKERSKQNAHKHGIFSKVILLKDEPRSQFDSLLRGLQEDLQSEGTLEEVLVEKLATLLWRHRRLMIAETAEIRKNMEFVESDQRNQERETGDRLWGMSAFLGGRGMIGNTCNRHVLECCLQGLAILRKSIEEVGFRPDQDAPILRKLYGERDVRRLRTYRYDSYETLRQIAETSEEEPKRKGYPSPAECRQTVIEEIDKEIRHINHDQKARASIETARTQLEIVCRNVPDGPGLDRLLRYEASLERSFDRTLSQLERLQRMRAGQPVPPELKVRLSG